MDEYTMIEQAKNGEREAFCQLYDLYRDRLYRYAWYRLKNESDAEDAVSECVLSAWKQIGDLRDAKAFPAWIFRILAAACNRIIRQQIRRREQPSPDDAQSESAAETRLILAEALELLDQEDRNMVLLSVVAGLSSQEIGDLTGLAPGSVRSRISRNMKKMRTFLERE